MDRTKGSGAEDLGATCCEDGKRYRQLFEHSNDGVFLLDVTREGRFRIVAFNPAEEQIVGVPNRLASGQYVDDLFSGALGSTLIGNYRRCVNAARPIYYDEQLALPAGLVSFTTTLVPLRDHTGRVHQIVGVARDVTKENAALNELRTSEKRFRALAENIREVFWMSDVAKSSIVYVSPGYESIWGRSRQSLHADPRSWLDAVHPEDRARVESWASGQRDGMTESTYRILRPDGSKRWIRDRSFPVRDERGDITCLVGLAEDITSVIQAETRLVQAQKLEALGRLAGGVAHDFNNTLSVILSYSDLLLTALEPGELRADMQEIRFAAQKAADFTRQLLAFSHQQVLEPTVFDLGVTVAGMKRMLCTLLGEDIDLVLSERPAGCFIHADPGQIERAIMNLAVNARDAMPQGGKLTMDTTRVNIGAAGDGGYPELRPGFYVVLSVGDNGIGMDAETHRRIFEPFFTTKEKGKGTGLGLATVFGIVEQSGGVIRVDTAKGKGSTFHIFLPYVHHAENAHTTTTPVGQTHGGTETILLAEDEPQVRATVRAVLRRRGYNVLEASNAGEALLICEQYDGAIDLLLTDVIMPRMSGQQLAKRLGPLRPEMKVLYMSGYGDAGRQHGALDPGAAVLDKPITPEALARKVRDVLG